MPPEVPDIINHNWWFRIPEDSQVSEHESITINDGKGTFVAVVTPVGSQAILQLPQERDSIRQITKGNKVGILTAGIIEGTYTLKLTWT